MKIKRLVAAFSLAASMALMVSADSTLAGNTPAGPAAQNNDISITTGHKRFWPEWAHQSFCRRNPSDCVVPPGGAKRVVLNDNTRRMLDDVNQKFNRTIIYREDKDNYGRADYWNYPDNGYGDCEDYAMQKRRELIARGWPPSSMMLALAITPSGTGHAVLVVRTDQGDFVLDNLRGNVERWDALPYDWFAIQDPARPSEWYTVRNGNHRPHHQGKREMTVS